MWWPQLDMLAVINFDVSPVDGSLVYVVQGAGGNLLVRADARGQQRTVLLNNVSVNNPRWSPDGNRIAVQIADPSDSSSGPVGGSGPGSVKVLRRRVGRACGGGQNLLGRTSDVSPF
jgi:dipeptidyl aminopeptidase/acylaminoacyl peptidase